MTMPDDLIPLSEAAVLLGYDRVQRVTDLIRRGKLGAVNPRGLRRRGRQVLLKDVRALSKERFQQLGEERLAMIRGWDFYQINEVTGFADHGVPRYRSEDAWQRAFTIEAVTQRRGPCPFTPKELAIMADKAITNIWHGAA